MNIDEQISAQIKAETKKSVDEKFKTFEKDFDTYSQKALEEKLKVMRPVVVNLGKKKVETGSKVRHESTYEILNYISARIPVLMVGPAGSGKTYVAVDCAEMLGLPCYSISVNEQTSKSDFLGYNDANGKIVKTNFRKAYEEGGVFIIDEIDAGNPNILTVINSALANDICPFPDGMVKRHQDFVCVCTANTYGDGESIQYIGRNILDAATKDRFACVSLGYSDALETMLLPKFKTMIQELRNHFIANSANVVVSTRGGMRLELISGVKEVVSLQDVVDCLNLQQEMNKDGKVKLIITKYLEAKAEVK